MTERETPPTARERAIFDAAAYGRPDEFVRLCNMLGRDPKDVLDSFDAAPWRWLIMSFSSPGIVSDSTRELRFPTRIRAGLDAARDYVETPWWRRWGRR